MFELKLTIVSVILFVIFIYVTIKHYELLRPIISTDERIPNHTSYTCFFYIKRLTPICFTLNKIDSIKRTNYSDAHIPDYAKSVDGVENKICLDFSINRMIKWRMLLKRNLTQMP